MLAKRIIPCLDIKNGRTVKGTSFVNIKDAGDPIELAVKYDLAGADELVFLDISATEERRKTLLPLVEQIAENISIPFTVGGGISAEEDVQALLNAGADKVSINSAAVTNPNLIQDLNAQFGKQCIVVAIDAKLEENGQWMVYINGGSKITRYDLFTWAIEVEKLGAGEILFTSISNDGSKSGFANDALKKLNQLVNIPVIASGGAGEMQHFADAFTLGNADAALAASVFHYNQLTIQELKRYLDIQKIPVRI